RELTQSAGVVVSTEEKVRANIATIYASIDASLSASTVLDTYTQHLLDHGWRKIEKPSSLLIFCKSGVELEISRKPELEFRAGVSRNVLALIMQYGAMSIQECQSQGSKTRSLSDGMNLPRRSQENNEHSTHRSRQYHATLSRWIVRAWSFTHLPPHEVREVAGCLGNLFSPWIAIHGCWWVDVLGEYVGCQTV
ncbi:MAG TPA: hypothetical protein VGL08_14065, partial [Paraburkholderia sp.]